MALGFYPKDSGTVRRSFPRDAAVCVPFLIAAAFLVFASVAAYRTFFGIDHLLAIRYDTQEGVEVLGDAAEAARFLITGWAAFALNTFLAAVLYARVRFFAYALSGFTAFFALLIFAATIIMISINS